MNEHADILVGIVSGLFLIIIGFIAWQGKRQIARIDKLEDKMIDIEENTNRAVNDMKDNYKSEFTNVRKDIADLKVSNSEHFGELKCSIIAIQTKLETKNGRSK